MLTIINSTQTVFADLINHHYQIKPTKVYGNCEICGGFLEKMYLQYLEIQHPQGFWYRTKNSWWGHQDCLLEIRQKKLTAMSFIKTLPFELTPQEMSDTLINGEITLRRLVAGFTVNEDEWQLGDWVGIGSFIFEITHLELVTKDKSLYWVISLRKLLIG